VVHFHRKNLASCTMSLESLSFGSGEQEQLRCSLLPPIHAIELATEKITNGISNFLSVRF